MKNNTVLTSKYGTKSNDLQSIANAFNNKETSEYAIALGYLSGYEMIEVEVIDGKLVFKK